MSVLASEAKGRKNSKKKKKILEKKYQKHFVGIDRNTNCPGIGTVLKEPLVP